MRKGREERLTKDDFYGTCRESECKYRIPEKIHPKTLPARVHDEAGAMTVSECRVRCKTHAFEDDAKTERGY